MALAVGLLSVGWRFKKDKRRSRLQSWSLGLTIVVGVACLFTVIVPAVLAALRNFGGLNFTDPVAHPQVTTVGAVGGSSLAAVILGILLQLRTRVSEPATTFESLSGIRRWLTRLPARVRRAFVYFAGAVASPLLFLSIVVGASLLTLERGGLTWRNCVLAGIALGLFGLTYWWGDLTTWSLHPYYRRRLCTAFALRRVPDPQGPPEGVARERKYDELVPLSETEVTAVAWPTLVVCAAANISNSGATPPGRWVTSFTFSANSMGGPLVGGVSTSEFEKHITESRRSDFTLLAAVAMSGAGLSAAKGKRTRSPFIFLMSLANIRLGVWVPNPRRISNEFGEGHEQQSHLIGRPRPSYLLRELFGFNNVNAKFLHVTDGGHYENLGLVELLRRGCAKIYCFDASAEGPGAFSTLGDAVALARSELGVDIDIDPSRLIPDLANAGLAKADTVHGTIHFPGGLKGTLVLARAVVTKEAPWDVHAYHQADTVFPNHPSTDQVYTDQKFEAYRALGELAGRHAVQQMDGVQRRSSRSSDSEDIVDVYPPDPLPNADHLHNPEQADFRSSAT